MSCEMCVPDPGMLAHCHVRIEGDAYLKLRADLEAARAEIERLRAETARSERGNRVLRAVLAETDPCIHVLVQQAVEAAARGELGVTLEELNARLNAAEAQERG